MLSRALARRTEDGVPGPMREAAATDDAWFAEWRSRELARLDRDDTCYLDYTGAPPFAASLLRADAARLAVSTHGNPHSQSGPSLHATGELDAARRAILDFLHADPAEYAVVLTANATGACRLVGESFPFAPASVYALAADNHNSVNGIREQARARGATVRVLPLDDELRLVPVSLGRTAGTAPSLLAFPSQSNFSGVRHPLDLIERAQIEGWRVLLDAAAHLPTADLDLREVRPDYLCLSVYKICGYPTGLGALVARHDALAMLQRPTFSGGTVRWVSIAGSAHLLAAGPDRFEDGTPNFLAAGAVALGLAGIRAAGRERLARHLDRLTQELLDGLLDARHGNGAPRVRVHGPRDTRARGATVAFTLLDDEGAAIPYWKVEGDARAVGIALRGGCFCNPGCSERAFRFTERPVAVCLQTLGDDFSIPAFAACLGEGEVGALRVSLGLGSVEADVKRLLAFVRHQGGSP